MGGPVRKSGTSAMACFVRELGGGSDCAQRGDPRHHNAQSRDVLARFDAHGEVGPTAVFSIHCMSMRGDTDSQAVTIILNERETASDRMNRLLPLVYEQLRAAANNRMASERAGHTLGATALVHEAYLKLVGPREIPWQNRGHFYAAAAEAMRQILLDHAKARGRVKRGGGDQPRERRPLDDAATLVAPAHQADDHQPDCIALDAAMCRLEARDPRMAQVVRLKYYAGLEIAQIALALGVSERTVKNDWAFAKAWLERELRGPAEADRAEAEQD